MEHNHAMSGDGFKLQVLAECTVTDADEKPDFGFRA